MRTSGNIGVTKQWISLNFNIAGIQATQRFLTNFGVSSNHMENALTKFGRYLLQRFRTRFTSEGGRTKWIALKHSTVLGRIREGFGGEHPILVRTGELKRSFTQEGAFGNYFNITSKSMEVGSLLNKASYHHFGNAHMPARQVAFIESLDNTMLTKIFQWEMKDKIQEASRKVVRMPPNLKLVHKIIG
jgi:hypothetical protein